MNPKDFMVLFSTCPDADTAATIAQTLVEERFVACVNVLPGVRSIYRWNEAIEEATEVLLVIKTTAALAAAARARLVALHPYETPEAVALGVVDGHDAYLRWVLDSTQGPSA
jgi:periplasmic divalent cation tolerance protein